MTNHNTPDQSASQSPLVPLLVLLIQGLFVFGLVSCSENEPQTKQEISAVHINDHDECHLCGMLINQFAGPKGEMFEKNKSSVRKFCSVNDLFAYMLQPENIHNTSKAFVHDMASSPWDNTRETELIDAKQAWYVVGHKLPGAMGPALASFKQKNSAEAFANIQGGQVLAFVDITLDVLNQAMQAHSMHHPDKLMNEHMHH